MSWDGTGRCYANDGVEIEIEVEATFTDDGEGKTMIEDYTMPVIRVNGRELSKTELEAFDAKELGVEGKDWNAAINQALEEAELKMGNA